MNSGGRIGGKQRTTFKIDLPPNTVKWYYSFSTSPNESQSKNTNLLGQLSQIVNTPTMLVADALFAPTGAGVIDIYLTDWEGSSHFMEKDAFGGWVYSKPNTFPEGSRENTKQAVVEIDDIRTGTVYLCFRNPSMTTGINISFEVVAIIEEEITNNGGDYWTDELKMTYYTNFYSILKENGLDDNTASKLSTCLLDNFVKTKSPKEWQAISEKQRNDLIAEIYAECIKKL